MEYNRDNTAKIQDESRDYVLPDELLKVLIQEIPQDVETLKAIYKRYPFEVSHENYDTIVSLLEVKDIMKEKKGLSKFEINERGTELLQSLFTPNRSYNKMNSSIENVLYYYCIY